MPMYPPNPYQPQPVVVMKNGNATASLTLGIIALVLSFAPLVGMVAWVLAPLGLVFGGLAGGKPVGQGARLAGLITSGLALLVCLVWAAFFLYGAVQVESQR